MIVESVDIIADWLGDTTYGVNALRTAVPRGHSDTAPPALANIVSEMRNDEVARGKFPEEQSPTLYPMLIVSRPSTVGLITPIRTSRWDGTVEIAIAHVIRDSASAKALRDSSYILRAVLRSLWALEDPSNSTAVAARQPSGLFISLRGFDDNWQLVGMQAPVNDKIVLGALIIKITLEDTKPGG